MNCRLNIPSSRRSDHGFTMIEIAIALGVIGFALVAIIGILPMGLDVQRDNRSETIINQDATLWLEAIRSGAVGMNELPSYVTNIVVEEFNVSANKYFPKSPPVKFTLNSGYQTGADIIGLISSVANVPTDRMAVYATSISGAAAEKELNPAKRELAFSYILYVVIDSRRDPEDDPNDTALPFNAVTGDPVPKIEHFGYPGASSLSEIRLTFAYPFIGENKTPPRSQTYRASVARHLVNDPNLSPYFFFRP